MTIGRQQKRMTVDHVTDDDDGDRQVTDYDGGPGKQTMMIDDRQAG